MTLKSRVSSVTAVLIATSVAALPAQAFHESPASNGLPIAWQACADEEVSTWECAKVAVPLDYSQPTGEQVELNVRRHRASNSEALIGSLFYLAGGPGTPSTYALGGFVRDLPADVVQRFNILAVDPRGASLESPAMCQAKNASKLKPASYRFFPTSSSEVVEKMQRDQTKSRICAAHSPKILNHMSSGTSAQDLETVRQRLGENEISIFSHGYASHLAGIYASRFGKHVRTVVNDSPIDSEAMQGDVRSRISEPVHLRIGSHKASAKAMDAAIRMCMQTAECPQQKTIARDWQIAQQGLKTGPVSVNVWGPEFTLHYDSFIALLRSNLSFNDSVADSLRLITATSKAVQRRDVRSRSTLPTPAAAAVPQGVSTLHKDPGQNTSASGSVAVDLSRVGVLCSDSIHPVQAWQVPAAIRRADQESNGFASVWGWTSSLCSGLRMNDSLAFAGSFSKDYAPLILHSTHDSMMPIAGAKAVRERHQGSRLVEVPQWSSRVFDSNSCAREAARKYLISGELPSADGVCPLEDPIFQP